MASCKAVNFGGKTGGLLLAYDWKNSPLGPKEDWPQNLTASVNFALSSCSPTVVFWGPQRVCIYNDACIPIFGLQHQAFGKPASEAWGEVWSIVEPLFPDVLAGRAAKIENKHIPLWRGSVLYEAYFSWTLTPVWGSDNTVAGAISSVVETTSQVLSERRFGLLHKLNKEYCATEGEARTLITSALTQATIDFPFTATYYLSTAKKLMLLANTGFEGEHIAIPPYILLDSGTDNKATWPIKAALSSGSLVEVTSLETKFAALPGGHWGQAPSMAIVVPLYSRIGTMKDVVGVFIAGISPRRPFDDAFRDFTELVTSHISYVLSFTRATAEHQKRAEFLTEADKAKTFFFSTVSYEFRTPLSLILGQVEESLGDTESPLPPTQKARQNVVHRNALRLLKLVNSLLDLSKIDAGRMKKYFVPIDLSQATADLANIFRPAIENAGLTLTINCPPIGELVYVDTDMWEKIICNLMSNALKYTFKGEIEVMVRKNAQVAEVFVSDTGVGIPENELPHVFERFRRVTGVTGRSFEGAGLGLALSQELVKLHQGTIHITSAVGTGSTFVVSLPLGADNLSLSNQLLSPTKAPIIEVGPTFVEEAARWIQNQPKPAENPSLPLSPASIAPQSYRVSALAHSPALHINTGDNRPSIVFASGSQDMQQFISSSLSMLYRVSIVTSGKKAIELAAIDPPDLILCDSALSELSGLQVLESVKEHAQLQRIPFVMIATTKLQRLDGLKDSADDYIVPPFIPHELQARINLYIELGRLRRNTYNFSLDKTEEYYRKLVHSLPVGIFELNSSHDIVFHNRKWAEITGYFEGRPPDAIVGKDWIECIHVDDRAMVTEALEYAQNTANTASFETRIQKRDGSIHSVFIDYFPSLETNGKLHGACATITDVTERVGPLRETLAEEQQRASKAEEHRRKNEMFVDMICHEIRNPINGIHNNVDLLMNGLRTRGDFVLSMPSSVNSAVLTEQITIDKEAIDSIIMCANQQRVVADDVLHLSALESGKVVLNDIVFDPRKIVERVVKTYRAEASMKQIQFLVNVPKDQVLIRGDPDRLLQVMFNLVSNAIKFTEKSEVKKITVSLEIVPGSPQAHENKTLGVTIEDTGVGMTPNEKSALFKRFSQASVHTYREYGGSGLGLFITKGLIDLMGGIIDVESEKFKGTKFHFTAKCKAPLDRLSKKGTICALYKAANSDEKPVHLDSPSPVESRRALSPRASLHILIAEDDVVNQKVLKRHLEQGHHVVTVASNGQKALDCVKHQRFDLIFMDVEMPVMGGLEATRAIRKEEERHNRPKIPIIGLSGNARKEYLRTALEAGMNSYIVKPYQKEDLFAKIHELVKLNG